MNSAKPIGGYFELELRPGGFLHDDAILLNSARNCFEYVLRANKPKKVYMPKYTCDVMMEPLEKLGIELVPYSISESFEIIDDINIKADELIVYTNYFGIKDDYCRKLSKIYGEKLVLDCSQAYFFEPLRAGHTIYSPRKFFGLPDGGCLYTGVELNEDLLTDVSHGRTSHLLKRIDEGAEEAYADFKANDRSLVNQPIKKMSELTKKLLGNIDFETAKLKRVQNFKALDQALSDSNRISFDSGDPFCPMVYPYFSSDSELRQKLIYQKIFVPTYWPNVLEWCEPTEIEYELAQQILPLPIDQRYGQSQMERIIGVINGN